MGYSEEQKLAIVRLFYGNNNNVRTVQREYHLLYPQQRVPSKDTIRYTVRKFSERKTLKRKKRTLVRNENQDLDILVLFQENPERSITDAASELNKTDYKIHSTLKFYKLHPYKFMPVQNLSEQNMRDRLQYALEIARLMQQDPEFLNKILFTDESSFNTAGMFNRKNKHYWSRENPHQIQPVRIQGRRSLSVWCGILGNKIIGPIFLDGNLNGERYTNLLQNEVEHLLEDLPIGQYNRLIWQQDGAPPHNTMPVTNYLNNRYDLWIGSHGTIRWPANSPDLNPLDIFLWGCLKNRVYYNRPLDLNVLRQRIVDEIFNLNNNYQQSISASVNIKMRENLFKLIQNQGGYVENN